MIVDFSDVRKKKACKRVEAWLAAVRGAGFTGAGVTEMAKKIGLDALVDHPAADAELADWIRTVVSSVKELSGASVTASSATAAIPDDPAPSPPPLRDLFSDPKFSPAFVTGAGVAASLSRNAAPTWAQLLKSVWKRILCSVTRNESLCDSTTAAVDAVDVKCPDAALLAKAGSAIQHFISNRGKDTGLPVNFREHQLQAFVFHVLRRVTCTDPALGIALGGFRNKHVPLLTLNYDAMLEEACVPARIPATHNAFLRVDKRQAYWQDIQSTSDASMVDWTVVHLHGILSTATDGFALSTTDYRETLDNFIVFMCDALTTSSVDPHQLLPVPSGGVRQPRTLVFVGADNTIVDHHFLVLWAAQALLRELHYYSRQSIQEPCHYILYREEGANPSKLQALAKNIAAVYLLSGVRIIPVSYGAQYDDLPGFINKLHHPDTGPVLNVTVSKALAAICKAKRALIALAAPSASASAMGLWNKLEACMEQVAVELDKYRVAVAKDAAALPAELEVQTKALLTMLEG